MGKITILNQEVRGKIAAGEVIDRPVSVVKELVENSIDANSTSITVEIKGGGISFVRVTDNGIGIEEDDTVVAFERHATSKVRTSEDLNHISTLGFRGEALASIAAVSQVELITKPLNQMTGTMVEINGGELIKKEEIGCPNGTTIIVKNLFYNTPARLKFLKKDSTEAGLISDLLERLSLTHPEISFKLINNNQTVLHTPGNGDVLTTILSVFGKEFAKAMIPIDRENNNIKITGFIGKPEIGRSNRNYQCIFINRRYIRNKIISSAMEMAYKTMLTINKFPVAVLYIDIAPNLVDVNVHPTKMEVRFSNEEQLYNLVLEATSTALKNSILIPQISLTADLVSKKEVYEGNKAAEKIGWLFPQSEPSKTYEQQNLQGTVKENVGIYVKPSNEEQINNNQYIDKSPIKSSIDSYQIQQTTSRQTIENRSTDKAAAFENQENEKNKENKKYRIVGQVFLTYVIFEMDGQIYIIDQHAAHERLKYNKLLEKYKENNNVMSQGLLSPMVVELTYNEFCKVDENKELFNNMGYEFEQFGDTTYIIRSVPYVLGENYAREFFVEVIDTLSSKKVSNIFDLKEEILHTMACKSAIKANRLLSQNEMEKLIDDVLSLEDAFTCPHGRPIIISISQYEFEKMFKRVQ